MLRVFALTANLALLGMRRGDRAVYDESGLSGLVRHLRVEVVGKAEELSQRSLRHDLLSVAEHLTVSTRAQARGAGGPHRRRGPGAGPRGGEGRHRRATAQVGPVAAGARRRRDRPHGRHRIRPPRPLARRDPGGRERDRGPGSGRQLGPVHRMAGPAHRRRSPTATSGPPARSGWPIGCSSSSQPTAAWPWQTCSSAMPARPSER